MASESAWPAWWPLMDGATLLDLVSVGLLAGGLLLGFGALLGAALVYRGIVWMDERFSYYGEPEDRRRPGA